MYYVVNRPTSFVVMSAQRRPTDRRRSPVVGRGRPQIGGGVRSVGRSADRGGGGRFWLSRLARVTVSHRSPHTLGAAVN